jgi:biopolymer transport protein TolQ
LYGWVLLQGSFGGFWVLVKNSGVLAQSVLLLLLLFSLLSWAIILKKAGFYRQVRRQSWSFHEFFRRSSTLSEIYREAERYPASPLAGIFRSGYEELTHQVDDPRGATEAAKDAPTVAILSLKGLERSLQKAATVEMTTLETSLAWLATTASVTPFIGLFGTVVGIINAFRGLGEGTATTIQAVAPGISEALITTAAGLFAAIPALIGYNHFLNRLKVFGAEMDDFSIEFLNLIERSFV